MIEPIPEDVAQAIAETKAIREGIANISAAFASLESSMAILLREILDPNAAGEVPFAIYYTPASAEVRFKIVDAAFCEFLGQSSAKDQDAFDILIAPWREFISKVSNAKDVRNAVAHGMISTHNRYNKNHVRLTPPIFDFRRIIPYFQKRQIPGLSAHDIQDAAARMSDLRIKSQLFLAIARARHARDDEALQKAFAAAAASLMTGAPQKVAQKQPKHRSQPQYSRAARRKAALARAAKRKP